MRLVAFSEKLALAQTSHPWWFLGVAIVVTIVAGISASGLRLDSQYEALLPEDSLQIRTASEVREKTGGTRQLVVAIEGDDPAARTAFGEKLVPLLTQMEEIRSVDLGFPGQFVRERALWLLDDQTLQEIVDNAERTAKIFHERQDGRVLRAFAFRIRELLDARQSELPSSDALVSHDGRYTFLLLIPMVSISDLPAGHRLMGEIEQIVRSQHPEDAGVSVRYAGTMTIYLEQHTQVGADLRNASILALVLCILVVAAFTRRLMAPALIAVTLICGIVWTYGIARIFVDRINMVTGFLGAVLMGLGIAFGVHLLMRYSHALVRNGGNLVAAVEEGVVGTLRPTLSSAMTTAGTFCGFVIATFPPFFEFGMIAALGVVMTLLATFLLLPPLLVVSSRKRTTTSTPQLEVSRDADERLKGASLPKWLAVALVVVFVALAGYGLRYSVEIPFVNDFKALRGTSEATEFTEYVSANLGLDLNPAVALVNSIDDARRVGQMARASIGETEGDLPYIGRVLTISDLLPPPDLEARRRLLGRLRVILEDEQIREAIAAEGDQGTTAEEMMLRMVNMEPWGPEDLPTFFRQRLMTIDRQQFVVFIWPTESVESDLYANIWEQRLRGVAAEAEGEGIEILVADEVLIRGWVSRLVLADAPRVIPLAALIVFLILLVDYRNLRRTLLVSSSLVVGMLGFIGVMHMMGMTLNMFNIVVIPSAIGIGIDASVHIYHRYTSEGPGSVVFVMRHTGAAVFLASVTTAIGFGSSLICHKVGLQTMGAAAIAGIGMTFLAAGFYFPSVLSLIEGRQRRSR
jgi:hypothetical protein